MTLFRDMLIYVYFRFWGRIRMFRWRYSEEYIFWHCANRLVTYPSWRETNSCSVDVYKIRVWEFEERLKVLGIGGLLEEVRLSLMFENQTKKMYCRKIAQIHSYFEGKNNRSALNLGYIVYPKAWCALFHAIFSLSYLRLAARSVSDAAPLLMSVFMLAAAVLHLLVSIVTLNDFTSQSRK